MIIHTNHQYYSNGTLTDHFLISLHTISSSWNQWSRPLLGIKITQVWAAASSIFYCLWSFYLPEREILLWFLRRRPHSYIPSLSRDKNPDRWQCPPLLPASLFIPLSIPALLHLPPSLSLCLSLCLSLSKQLRRNNPAGPRHYERET